MPELSHRRNCRLSRASRVNSLKLIEYLVSDKIIAQMANIKAIFDSLSDVFYEFCSLSLVIQWSQSSAYQGYS